MSRSWRLSCEVGSDSGLTASGGAGGVIVAAGEGEGGALVNFTSFIMTSRTGGSASLMLIRNMVCNRDTGK